LDAEAEVAEDEWSVTSEKASLLALGGADMSFSLMTTTVSESDER
jgi:hypothetical protein